MADLVPLVVRNLHIFSAILWIGALGFSVMVLRRVMPRLEMPPGRMSCVSSSRS